MITGEVWATGSRQYRSAEERLITKQALQDLLSSGTLRIAIKTDFETFIAKRRGLLDERLARVNLTGDYIWLASTQMSENDDGLRALRTVPEPLRKAA